jgi:hypothetical protein
MSSFLYPFRTLWLKSSMSREEIEKTVKNHTVLSYARSAKRDGKAFFFGEVSNEEFWLETIDNTGKLCPFIRCNIKGIDDETYLELELRGFRFARFYAAIVVVLLIMLIFSVKPFIDYGSGAFENPVFVLLPLFFLLLASGLFYFNRRFAQQINTTKDFFRGMLEAEVVSEQEIPLVFKL